MSNVTASLTANSARTYAAEIVVIWEMYIGEFGTPAREALASLVANKQLEFVGAGWVQPDEVRVHASWFAHGDVHHPREIFTMNQHNNVFYSSCFSW